MWPWPATHGSTSRTNDSASMLARSRLPRSALSAESKPGLPSAERRRVVLNPAFTRPPRGLAARLRRRRRTRKVRAKVIMCLLCPVAPPPGRPSLPANCHMCTRTNYVAVQVHAHVKPGVTLREVRIEGMGRTCGGAFAV